jgi:hypothetical protein
MVAGGAEGGPLGFHFAAVVKAVPYERPVPGV